MSLKATKGLLFFYGLLVGVLPLLGLGQALFVSLGGGVLGAQRFTLRHWLQLLTTTDLLGSLLYSAYITFFSMAAALWISLTLVLRTGNTLQRQPFPGLLYVPLLFPAIVLAFYLFQLLSRSGWLSRITFQLRLTPSLQAFPELVQDAAGLGIILAYVLMAFPFFTLLFRSLYADANLAELSRLTRSLGASEQQFRRRVAVPVLLRRAAPTLALYAVSIMGAYDIPLLLGRTYPQMVSVYITDRLNRFDLYEIPLGYGAGFLVALFLLSIIGSMARTTRNDAG